ncbi:YebC/PmpR family DNA-binding transcriptional regulator [Candidatus Wolfebacteria bacterium]|nr:YebC/PmpR family DNA-binding transcriptional regulator [Candidatus Wolfebacteria bacterium]
MSGHSKWSTIKHKKEATDKKRGLVFSKLLNAVAVAARQEPNPQFNPTLRTAVEKAKENSVPTEKIEAAIKRASSAADNLEELIMEAYGPEGAAIIIEAITDSKNRTVSEVKKILNDYGAKRAEAGSARWAFENINGVWRAKIKQNISPEAEKKLSELIQELENRDDIQKIYDNFRN